jgi:hypothetical protein
MVISNPRIKAALTAFGIEPPHNGYLPMEAFVENYSKSFENLSDTIKKMKLKGRFANQADTAALSELRAQLVLSARKLSELSDEERAVFPNFYGKEWDPINPKIIVIENGEGKIVGMAAVAHNKCLMDLSGAVHSAFGLIQDVVVDESQRYLFVYHSILIKIDILKHFHE